MIPSEIVYHETPEEIRAREEANAEATQRSHFLAEESRRKTKLAAIKLGIPFHVMRELEELREFKRREENRPLLPIPDLTPYIPGCCR